MTMQRFTMEWKLRHRWNWRRGGDFLSGRRHGQLFVPAKWDGLYGKGGISGVVLFEGDAVPDGGTAVLMLGAVLIGLGLLGRKAGG